MTGLGVKSFCKFGALESAFVFLGICHIPDCRYEKMKIRNSLKSLKGRHRANRVVRRRGRVYVINKENPRFKARQG